MTLVRYADHPELREVRFEVLVRPAFPEYMNHNVPGNRYWSRLYADFPEFQLGRLDGDDLVAESYAVPTAWDGTPDDLPSGWDEAFLRAFESGRTLDVLCALAISVRPDQQGRRLSGEMLEAMRDAGRAAGLRELIAPVRPTLKASCPLIPISVADCPNSWQNGGIVPREEKLALVVRVSDVKGRDKKGDRFISPDEQVRDGTAYARSAGYEIERFDDLNVSHTVPLDERPGMSAALKLIEAGRLAGIVVSSQDRLGTLTITRELKARLLAAGGVLKVADNPGAEQLDARGYSKLPTEYIALLHEAQREEIGLRWTKARRNAVERGVHPSTYVPIGYRRNTAEPRVMGPARLSLTPEARWADPVVGQLVPNEWAPVIVELFRLRAAGGSWTECCKLLEGRGVPNAKGEPFWIHSAVQRIIRNPVYKGTAYLRSRGKQAGDIINEEAHEPIVDPFLWKKAKPKEGKPRRTSEGALLAGILRCACCGRRLTPSGRHYRCRPRMVKGPLCEALANAPMAEVEAVVTRDFLGAIAYRPKPPAPADLEPFEKAVALGRAGEEQWKERAIAGESPEIVLPAFEAAKARREEAEERLAEARAAAGLSDERATLAERWETMTVPERRRTLQAFGVEVLVKRGREPVANRIALMFNAERYRGAATGEDFEPEIVVEHEFV